MTAYLKVPGLDTVIKFDGSVHAVSAWVAVAAAAPVIALAYAITLPAAARRQRSIARTEMTE
jgi:hypothetical protein